MTRSTPILAALLVAGMLGGEASAADLFVDDAATLLRTETITAEVFTGYLMTSAREYVYNSPGDNSKVSQLNWNGNGLALGGRLAFRPLDWLTIRAKGWASVAGESQMTDYDWLGGYYGPNSWTHRSFSPGIETAKSWQGDLSAAAEFYRVEDLAFSAIAGYRFMTTKWNASGGTYIYSSATGFRNDIGTLPSGQLGIGYQQWWQTPYLGLGTSYSTPDWTFSTEVIGSPFVMARDQDHHALRDLVFKEKFSLGGMVGFAGAVEYRFTQMVSLTGRVEYQNYMLTKGDTRVFDGGAGTVTTYPKPAGGASAETLLVSIGVKARM